MHHPPIAAIHPHTHSDGRVDPYHWLTNEDNPAVLAYLTAENDYTEACMEQTEALQQQLYQELRQRIPPQDNTVPWRLQDYEYYFRYEPEQEYPLFCRCGIDGATPETVLIDENALAAQHAYCDVSLYEISPNQQLLAYAVDVTGDEHYTLYIKNLITGALLPDIISDIGPSATWANDNQTLFYTKRDATERPYAVYRHCLGTDPSADPQVFQETDEHFYVDVYRSKTDRYIYITLTSHVTTEMHYMPANTPEAAFKVLYPREQGVEYDVVEDDSYFYIRTNKHALNFQLLKVPQQTPQIENATIMLLPRDQIKIEDIEVCGGYLVITERDEGLIKFRLIHLKDSSCRIINFDEAVYTADSGNNVDIHCPYFRFTYTSLTQPNTTYDYDLTTGERSLRKQEQVVGGYHPEEYHAERVWAISADGTKVPISLVYKKHFMRTQPKPLYLYGYGAYGAASDVWFSSNRLSLLDRGFIFAIAHVRGGGDLGEAWYQSGKLLRKKNSFNDFIAAAKYLITYKYTTAQQLIAYGASAGGLLVTAAMIQAPHLFRSVIADVPFVDALNTMLDPSLPLTVAEYEEWGNPAQPTYYAAIKGYSPYDNLKKDNYPNILITTSLYDTHVHYAEAAKFVAKLRTLKMDDNLLLLKTAFNAGHGGASGRYESLKEIALQYAFIFKTLGLIEQLI